jgi:hypothetical protein
MVFSLLNPLVNKNNSLEAHLSNLGSPLDKLEL